jgi:NAD(P)-dependent dehydrogenase (short-subunit alcohol dehydrogenase family)
MAVERNVLITGVSRGLGQAMVEQFVTLGHRVVGCARSASAIEALQQRYGPPHRFDVVDVSDDRQVGQWRDAVVAGGEVPDLLLNSAAIINRSATLWEVPPDEFSRVVDINIKGVYHVIRHFVPAMVAQRRGVIVNFSSTWGRSTSPQEAPYCATKWAIEGLTKALASELPRGMAAVAMNPGIIHTAMLETCLGRGAAAYTKPAAWAVTAVPFLLGLGPKDNGRAVSAPQ